MLSYRHAFHAGNYADVLKHFVLCRCLDYLLRKPSSLRYIDTHAGAGVYDLDSPEALRLDENQQGIQRLLTLDRSKLPASVVHYIDVVETLAKGRSFYPGSPAFASQLLRADDSLHLCELHAADFSKLKNSFKADRRCHCYFEDGFEKALALLPPLEKRALILIDPSYEVKEDYRRVVNVVSKLHRKFSTALIIVWYPIVNEHASTLVKGFRNSGIADIQRFELSRSSDKTLPGMNSNGVLVINPPWPLKEEVEDLFRVFGPLISDTNQTLALSETLVDEKISG